LGFKFGWSWGFGSGWIDSLLVRRRDRRFGVLLQDIGDISGDSTVIPFGAMSMITVL
jgi:hypothetical protein